MRLGALFQAHEKSLKLCLGHEEHESPNLAELSRKFSVVFCIKDGLALQIPISKGRSVTAEFYKNTVLKQLK